GNGALDIGAAINGPGRLDWGDFSVAFNGISSTWHNHLTGEGTLIKRGDGTLVLMANADNLGGLRVEQGSVQFHAYIGGDVVVGSSGHLQFASPQSRVRAGLDNAGVVELGRAIGGEQRTFSTVEGNYRHRDTATLQLSLGQSLDVIGTATIEG